MIKQIRSASQTKHPFTLKTLTVCYYGVNLEVIILFGPSLGFIPFLRTAYFPILVLRCQVFPLDPSSEPSAASLPFFKAGLHMSDLPCASDYAGDKIARWRCAGQFTYNAWVPLHSTAGPCFERSLVESSGVRAVIFVFKIHEPWFNHPTSTMHP